MSQQSSDLLTPLREALRNMLRALRYRNYRLFFGGQSISLIGTWLTRVAMGWLVYRLTRESHPALTALLLGAVGFAGQIPIFLLAPLGGVLVDRWDRRKILVVTQILSLLQSLALAVLALAHIITIPEIIGLAIFQGVINAFDMPARQAFVVEMIENKEDLPNAIALNSSMFNGARLVGPAVGGFLIAAVGEGFCFLIDAISYLAVIAALLAMTVKPAPPQTSGHGVRRDFREGLSYVFGFAPIRTALTLVALISFMTMPFQVLLPIFADRLTLAGHGAQTLGFLMATCGVGALGAAIYLASRRTVVGLGRVMVLFANLLGAGLILFAFSNYLWLSLLAMLLTGFSMICVIASTNTVLQTLVDDDKRGRTMSFYGMAVMGMAPFGSLAAGWLATQVGDAGAIALSGCACIAGGLWYAAKLPALRKVVRPIYVKKGIISEVAAGIQSASESPKSPEN